MTVWNIIIIIITPKKGFISRGKYVVVGDVRVEVHGFERCGCILRNPEYEAETGNVRAIQNPKHRK
jgi:hypothetical protein